MEESNAPFAASIAAIALGVLSWLGALLPLCCPIFAFFGLGLGIYGLKAGARRNIAITGIAFNVIGFLLAALGLAVNLHIVTNNENPLTGQPFFQLPIDEPAPSKPVNTTPQQGPEVVDPWVPSEVPAGKLAPAQGQNNSNTEGMGSSKKRTITSPLEAEVIDPWDRKTRAVPTPTPPSMRSIQMGAKPVEDP